MNQTMQTNPILTQRLLLLLGLKSRKCIQTGYLLAQLLQGAAQHGLTSFFEFCEVLNCRIDYLATHDYAGKANQVMNRLEMLYNRYGRKIWLTEFAKCCTRGQGEVETFVKAIIPRLEAAEYVYRYSWFITRYNDKYSHGWNTSQASTNDWYLDKVNALFEEGSTELS